MLGLALANVVDGAAPIVELALNVVDGAPNVVGGAPKVDATGGALVEDVAVELANLLVDPLQFMALAAAGAGGGGVVYIPRGGAPYWCIDAFDVLVVDGPLSDEMLAVEPRLLKKLLRFPPPDWLGSMPSVAKRSWCDGAAGFWRKRVPALCGRRRLFADDGGEATPKNPSCDRRSPFIFFQVTEPSAQACRRW